MLKRIYRAINRSIREPGCVNRVVDLAMQRDRDLMTRITKIIRREGGIARRRMSAPEIDLHYAIKDCLVNPRGRFWRYAGTIVECARVVDAKVSLRAMDRAFVRDRSWQEYLSPVELDLHFAIEDLDSL